MQLQMLGRAYIGERRVGEEGEAFEKILVVIVLDHRRPVSLTQRQKKQI